MARIGGHFVFLTGLGAQPHRAHQRLDAIEAAGVAVLRAQYPIDAGCAVTAALRIKDGPDGGAQVSARVVAP
ncbi:MAG: hypothetical protein ABIP64_01190 [Burkholderiales bacterium]